MGAPIELPDVVSPTAAQRELMPRALALLNDEEPCALFYDLERLREVLLSIKEAFPASATHAIAMKANPLAATLIIARDLGMGCEVASPGEFEHALRLGFAPARIVMDSPAKTRRDLRRALAAGVRINADNFDELARIDAILAADYGGGGLKGLGSCTSPSIGVRINPQLGEGAIGVTGTVAPTSKFGLPLSEVSARARSRAPVTPPSPPGAHGSPCLLRVASDQGRAARGVRKVRVALVRARARGLAGLSDGAAGAGGEGGPRPCHRDQLEARRGAGDGPRPRRRAARRLRLGRAGRRGARAPHDGQVRSGAARGGARDLRRGSLDAPH